ncbi:FG-GAP-like repeat-containing protein [Zeaxanthinibacter sp. PT1]|uniref:FG-GAP-like repeat-containing protein n=1 Tax=Zeaxanthinibacter TaxID=561554 RepID=UPI0023495D5F|nr:FG-GAP-like repeat-containing protein [Zeaxanthinibacter sp. PT1]MDC6351869.1 FG-GAP-like repeat-containing protein [Zeaxanthinibacter sp. PT1]
MAIKRNTLLIFQVVCLWISFAAYSQTTFTESAAVYGINIGGNKDGGHAWADYDLDGDFDLVVNTQGPGYLLRNDGGVFTDQTAALAPDFNNGSLERTALFVDFNNDGYPDIFRNKHNDIRIYLQDPVTNRFGDGAGGTLPSQQFTSFTDGMNTEGAGALDYDGDGDLDIFVDNHNFGIDILQNDGNGFFTHVTRKTDSPNPPYNAADPTTWPLGLVQDATDGDYGSATDFNDDGWVDIVVRKKNQVDLFTNVGGTFQDGVDIDQADNGNKGSVAFYDFDNDGDFDLFWTENGSNQIHRNNGDGTWTPLGAATGIPLSFAGQIEGLACGDVDNDGDIDIFLTGSSTTKLFLNQINNGGGPMSFMDSGQAFNVTDGQGSSFVDIDQDGDLDIYVNRKGNNRLFINNLGLMNRNNHLFINIKEDRDELGLTGSEERFGVGSTARILDCDGNVISGVREVNGGYGHGTQQPGMIHFGLPGGAITPIVVEVSYPRTSSGRVIVRQQLRPVDYFNGNINLLEVFTDLANLPPVAENDYITVVQDGNVTFDALANNGDGPDSDPEGEPMEVISVTVPVNGTAVINGDGTITYTPDPGYSGNDQFSYTMRDNSNCTFTAEEDSANVYITISPDTDGDLIADRDDLDDDNDGIPDTEEIGKIINNDQPDCGGETNLDFSLAPTLESGTALTQGAVYRFPDVTTGTDALVTIVQTFNATVANIDNNGSAASSFKPQTAFSFPNTGDQGYIEYKMEFVNSGGTTPVVIPRLFINFNDIDGGANYAEENWADNPSTFTIDNPTELTMGTDGSWVVATGSLIDHPGSTNSDPEVNFTVNYNSVSVLTIRVGALARVDGASAGGRQHAIEFACINNYVNPETYGIDLDSDGIANHLDLDSDNDGIYDAVEAGHDRGHSNGVVNSTFGLNGLADIVETSPESGTINYGITNSDGTDPEDYLDTDSDDDGCSDANEAYNDPSADGGDNMYYGTGTLPPTDARGRVSAAAYPVPSDINTNSVADHQEAGAAPVISVQPPDTAVCPGCDTVINVLAGNADTYQWQYFDGSSWVDLSDSGIYSGTQTATLVLNNVTAENNGDQYRVLTANTMYICSTETSTTATLILRVNTVISNRRITYRVNRN